MRAAEEVTDRLCAFEQEYVSEQVAEIDIEFATLRRAASRPSRPTEVARRIAELERERKSAASAPRGGALGRSRALVPGGRGV
jgi:hypothetical protein